MIKQKFLLIKKYEEISSHQLKGLRRTYNRFAAMDNRSWLEKPQEISENNVVPILPTTLKALKISAADYRRNGIRPKWGTTRFQNLVVVARIISSDSKLVLTDNTDILAHQPNKRPVGSQLFLRHQYYRFIFEITPYSSDSLAILSIQPVSPIQVAAHLSEVVQEDLKSQLHLSLQTTAIKENEPLDANEKMLEQKKQVMRLMANWGNFTLGDIQQAITIQPEELTAILQELGEEGKIGDMGSYYFVNFKPE